MDEKLESENMQKEQFSMFILRAIGAGRWRERRYAEHIGPNLFRYSLIQNAAFRSEIFKIFFASGGKGALTL